MQVERSSTKTNAEVQRQTCPAEEPLFDYPFVLQSKQMALNGMPSLGDRKSEKLCNSPDQWTQPQSFEASVDQQEACRLTTEYEISDRKQKFSKQETA